MPCDAIATVTVSVPLTNLSEDPARCGQLLSHHLKSQGFTDVRIQQTTPVLALKAGTFLIRVRGQQVSVAGGRRKENLKLAENIQQFLAEVAGVQFQQQIHQLLAAKYSVTRAEYAPNRSLVLSLKL